jgi:hypothetical protein
VNVGIIGICWKRDSLACILGMGKGSNGMHLNKRNYLRPVFEDNLEDNWEMHFSQYNNRPLLPSFQVPCSSLRLHVQEKVDQSCVRGHMVHRGVLACIKKPKKQLFI